MTYMIGIIGIVYSTQALLMGGMTTLFIFSVLTIYAWQTKYDYTVYGNVLLVILFSLLLFGFIISFFNIPILQTIYSVVGAMLFSFYIIYDTQMIVGGNHRKITFTKDDYVIASISLYVDIVNLFLFIMDIFDSRN